MQQRWALVAEAGTAAAAGPGAGQHQRVRPVSSSSAVREQGSGSSGGFRAAQLWRLGRRSGRKCVGEKRVAREQRPSGAAVVGQQRPRGWNKGGFRGRQQQARPAGELLVTRAEGASRERVRGFPSGGHTMARRFFYCLVPVPRRQVSSGRGLTRSAAGSPPLIVCEPRPSL